MKEHSATVESHETESEESNTVKKTSIFAHCYADSFIQQKKINLICKQAREREPIEGLCRPYLRKTCSRLIPAPEIVLV